MTATCEVPMSRPVVLITGASKGIGRALVFNYAKNGANVIGVARNKDELYETMADAERRFSVRSIAIEGDVSKPESVDAFFSEALRTFPRIDVLINNAGVGSFDRFIRLSDAEWRSMINVNLKGAVLCTRHALAPMLERRDGIIVNVSSICGLTGYAECSAYCASKFALVGFSDALAREVALFNISVYAVCPDIVDTSFASNRNASLTRREKMLAPEEVADFIYRLTIKRPRSQVCKLGLHPLTSVFYRIGLRRRAIVSKRIHLK